MARVIIDDRWLRTAEDGTVPSSAAKRSLANTKDPIKARVPEKWRTSIYGTGKRWRVRWYVTGSDGKNIQKNRHFEKLSDAESFKAAMEDDIRAGRYRDPNAGHRLFRVVAEEWLRSKVDIKDVTLGRYMRDMRVYVYPQWGDVLLSGIAVKDVQSWANDLAAGNYKAELPLDKHGVMRKPKPLSPSSIKNIVRVVMYSVLDYAVKHDYLAENVIDKVITPKRVKQDDMVFLTIPEVEQLATQAGRYGRHPKVIKGIETWPDDTTNTHALLVRFLAYTGVRIGEAMALTVRDLDLAHCRARIRRTWTDDKNGNATLGLPKNGTPRTIAMPVFLRDALRQYVAGLPESDYVFRGEHGGSLYVRTWRNRVFNRAVRNAGMEDNGIPPHSLRHTYASIAIANGADVKTLQKQLGHAMAAMTLDVYAALWPERLGEVADAVECARGKALTPAGPAGGTVPLAQAA